MGGKRERERERGWVVVDREAVGVYIQRDIVSSKVRGVRDSPSM